MIKLKEIVSKQRIQDLVTSLLQVCPLFGISSFVYIGNPFLFQDPYFECRAKSNVYENCSLYEACQYIKHKEYVDYKINHQLSSQSIVEQFGLYCENGNQQRLNFIMIILLCPVLFRCLFFMIRIRDDYKLKTIGICGFLISISSFIVIYIDQIVQEHDWQLGLIVTMITVQYCGYNLLNNFYFMVIYSVYDSDLAHKVVNPFGYILNVTFPLIFIVIGQVNHNNWKRIMLFNAIILALCSFYITFFQQSIDQNAIEHNHEIKVRKQLKIHQIISRISKKNSMNTNNQQEQQQEQQEQQEQNENSKPICFSLYQLKDCIKYFLDEHQNKQLMAAIVFTMYFTLNEGIYIGIFLELDYLSYSIHANSYIVVSALIVGSFISPLIINSDEKDKKYQLLISGILFSTYFFAPIHFKYANSQQKLLFSILLFIGLVFFQFTVTFTCKQIEQYIKETQRDSFFQFCLIIQGLLNGFIPQLNFFVKTSFKTNPICLFGLFIIIYLMFYIIFMEHYENETEVSSESFVQSPLKFHRFSNEVHSLNLNNKVRKFSVD